MNFEGTYVAMITPFTDDGKIDEEGFRSNINYLIDKGVSIRNNIIHSGKDRMAIMNFYSNSEDEYYDDLNKVVVYYYYFLKFVLLQFLEVDLSEYIEETYIPTLIEYE